MNVVCLTGELIRDPVVHPSEEAPEECSFELAVRRRRPRSGLTEPGVVYIPVQVTGGEARDCASKLRAGTRVEVFGLVDAERERLPNGEWRVSHRVLADRVVVFPLTTA